MLSKIMLSKIVLAVALLCGCASGAIHRDARAGNSKLATRVLGFSSGRQCDLRTLRCENVLWRQTGWDRIGDQTEPAYVVVVGDGTACVVWETLVYAPEPDHYWACESAWRIRSMR